jgi:hypothetical protein
MQEVAGNQTPHGIAAVSSSAGAMQIKPMTGPRCFVIFVAALAVLLAIVMATDGHPLAVIATVLVAIFLTGRLTR